MPCRRSGKRASPLCVLPGERCSVIETTEESAHASLSAALGSHALNNTRRRSGRTQTETPGAAPEVRRRGGGRELTPPAPRPTSPAGPSHSRGARRRPSGPSRDAPPGEAAGAPAALHPPAGRATPCRRGRRRLQVPAARGGAARRPSRWERSAAQRPPAAPPPGNFSRSLRSRAGECAGGCGAEPSWQTAGGRHEERHRAGNRSGGGAGAAPGPSGCSPGSARGGPGA